MQRQKRVVTDLEFADNVRHGLEWVRKEFTNDSQVKFAERIRMSGSHYKNIIRGTADIGAIFTFREIYRISGLCIHELGQLQEDPKMRLKSKITKLNDEDVEMLEKIVDWALKKSTQN